MQSQMKTGTKQEESEGTAESVSHVEADEVDGEHFEEFSLQKSGNEADTSVWKVNPIWQA